MIEVLIDGRPVEISPRRAEMIRQLLEADPRIDTMDVGAVEFRLAQEKVQVRVTESSPGVRVADWANWRRGRES